MKRGRPPHPDILTPREQEVLALIREGLSNEQIAQRLGISVDGAKYHVSEMLSKLHLDNRSDLAKWQPDTQRPWLAGALAPLAFWRIKPAWLSGAIAGGLAIVLAGGIGVLAWALVATRDNGKAAPADAPQSADDVYAQMLERLENADGILHTTVSTSSIADQTTQQMYTMDVWIDARQESIRTEFHKDPSWEADIAHEDVSIAAGAFVYRQDDPGEALRTDLDQTALCGANVTISILLECGSGFHLTENKGTPDFVSGASYEGHPAIALLLFDGTLQSEESPPTKAISHAYIDPDSLLPIARVTELQEDPPTGQVGEIRSVYGHELVSPDSLPADFFDPRSIGYGLADADERLDEVALEVPVYWLGEEFAPGEGLDELVLTRIDTEITSTESGEPFGDFAGLLYYETPGGLSGINLFLWSPASFEEFIKSNAASYLLDPACADATRTMTAVGEAMIYVLPDIEFPLVPEDLGACIGRMTAPSFTFANVIAIVELENVIIDVRSDPTGDYESLEAIEAVLAGLRPRE